MKKIFLIAFVLGFSFLMQAQQQKTTPPVIVQKVPLGKSISVHNDYSIDFLKVTEDSRCPKGVECVWAGQAKVLLLICKDGKEIEKKEVLLPNFSGEEPAEINVTDSKKVYIYPLKPYPTPETKNKLAYYLQIATHKK